MKRKIIGILFTVVVMMAMLCVPSFAAFGDVKSKEMTDDKGNPYKMSYSVEDETLVITGEGELTFSWSDVKRGLRNSSQISSIEIGEGITKINPSYKDRYQADRFPGELKNIQIPKSMQAFPDFDMYDKQLAFITLREGNPYFYQDEQGVLYSADRTKLIMAPVILEGSYVIPDTVTEIGKYAFMNSNEMSAVKLPKNLVKIGRLAFQNCDSLESIVIPKSLETADVGKPDNSPDYGVFSDCSNLKTASFEDGIVMIPEYLFSRCDGLESVTIPGSVRRIDDYAFYMCENLKTVRFDEGLEKIGFRAFSRTSLEKIKLPDTVEDIGEYCFELCTSLVEVTLSKKLIYISKGAFWDCSALKEIEIPASLKEPTRTLSNPNVGTTSPFKGCTALKKVTFAEGLKHIPMYLFEDSFVEEVDIPKSVVSIGKATFKNCDNLCKVEFPDSLNEIKVDAFAGCSSLETARLPGSLKTLGDGAFDNCSALTEIFLPKSLQSVGSAFSGCSAPKSVTLEEGITFVPNLSGCTGFDTVVIPESVTTIEEYAFSGCELNKIVIPASVTSIGDGVFQNCSKLTSVELPSHLTELPRNIFMGCTALTSIDLPAGLTSIGNGAFRGCAFKEIVLPETVAKIGEYAFADCFALETMPLNDNITYIDVGLFSNCDALRTLAIPDQIKSIGENAFYDCDGMTTLTTGKKLESIGDNAFYDCDALTSIKMCHGVRFLHYNAFRSCDQLKDVKLSRNLSSIYDGAFSECAELEEIIVPYMAEYVGNILQNCPKLKKVVIRSKVNDISSEAFSSSDNAVIYGVASSYAEAWAAENGRTFQAYEAPATSIALAVKEFNGDITFSEFLDFEIIPADHTDEIVCTSSNVDVVRVSDGDLTVGDAWAIEEGTATVTVTVGNVSDSVKINIGSGHEHQFDEWYVFSQPTCTEPGGRLRSCTGCGELEDEIIPALGHKFSDGKCSTCGAKDPNYVEPTPTPPTVTPTPTPPAVTPTPPAGNNPFTDVPNDAWYAAPVLWAKANNVTGGKTETTFGPDDSCTRAQVVTFLWAANGKPEPKSMNNPFKDVADNAWYLKPVLWAVEQGITGGVAEGKFGPEQTCTRAQIATFLYAAAGKPEVSGKSTFKDVKDADWFAKPIIWAAQNEVTGGIGDGKFGPNNTCTRAQVVTFLYKVYGNK